LRSNTGRQIEIEEGRDVALAIARQAAERLRKAIREGKTHLFDQTADPAEAEMLRIQAERRLVSLHRVINATGVIIHTNL
ncbi:hypothetical protein WAH63_22605, partial [Acinetobacter baumannii]